MDGAGLPCVSVASLGTFVRAKVYYRVFQDVRICTRFSYSSNSNRIGTPPGPASPHLTSIPDLFFLFCSRCT